MEGAVTELALPEGIEVLQLHVELMSSDGGRTLSAMVSQDGNQMGVGISAGDPAATLDFVREQLGHHVADTWPDLP